MILRIDTESTYVRCAFVGNPCTDNPYTIDINTIKYLRVDSQSFQISEIKLFGTWLEIRIESYWFLLYLFWMLSRLTFIIVIFEVEDARLAIQVGANWLSNDL